MTRPTYTASGGVIFSDEHRPMTMEHARFILAVHQHNARYWMGREDLSEAARLLGGKVEQELADEMALAIQAVTQPMERAA